MEPGGQAAGGRWPGLGVSQQVVDYVQQQNYGGVQFWAINQPKWGESNEVTGENVDILAKYARAAFGPN